MEFEGALFRHAFVRNEPRVKNWCVDSGRAECEPAMTEIGMMQT